MGTIAVLAFLAPAPAALAWPTVDPDGYRVPVLGGRWTVAMPETTARAAATPQPGAPTPREALDSVGVYESPNEGNFAVRGTMLESTRPDDLEAAVRSLPAPCAAPEYGRVGDRTDLVAVRCSEPSPDGALRPLSVYAVHSDGWVDRIETLLETTNPDDAAARTAGVAYAEAVIATLRADSSTDAVERGTVEVARACEADGAADTLTLTLPEGWVAIRDPEPDGVLLRLMSVVPLGGERAIAAVQLVPAGSEPQRVPEGVGVLEPGQLLGNTVEWLVIHQDGAPTGVRRLATEVTVDCGGGATFARALWLSVGGPTATLDRGQRVIESLALGGGRGHTAAVAVVSSEAQVVEPDVDDDAAGGRAEVDRETERQGHFWSIAIGAGSLLLLGAALVMRGRTTRPK